MLQILLAFSLSWGEGIKYDGSGSGGYGPAHLLRARLGMVGMEAGSWIYESSKESYIWPAWSLPIRGDRVVYHTS